MRHDVEDPTPRSMVGKTATRGPSRLRTLRGYLLLPHLVPVAVVEAATAAFAIIAWNGLPPVAMLAALLLAMLGAQLAIGATNELVDLPFDAASKPTKPLATGDVSIRGARIMVGIGLTMMIAFGVPFGLTALGLLMLGTGLGLAYDLWFKRTAWSWLPYLLALPLLPIWVFTAVGRPEPRLLLLYPLGSLATIGVHFAQALPDVAIDREAGLSTAPSRLGREWSLFICWSMTLTAPVLSWVAARSMAMSGAANAIFVAAGATLLLLIVNLALLALDRRFGTVACFPLVALATLLNGLAWTVTVA